MQVLPHEALRCFLCDRNTQHIRLENGLMSNGLSFDLLACTVCGTVRMPAVIGTFARCEDCRNFVQVRPIADEEVPEHVCPAKQELLVVEVKKTKESKLPEPGTPEADAMSHDTYV